MYTLITGTTSGIGKEFAELFAKKGYNLVTVAMNEEKLKEQKQTLESKYNISVKYIVKDLSIEESYSEIYNEVKASNIEIDILINNAGFATYGNYIDVEWQKQKNLAMVNMMAVMQLSYMFGKDMAKRKSGRERAYSGPEKYGGWTDRITLFLVAPGSWREIPAIGDPGGRKFGGVS